MTTKTPFYVGQPVDEVRYVAEKTNRRRLAVEFEAENGETYRFDLDADTARKRRRLKVAMEAELQGKAIHYARIPKVRYVYPDCALTFEKTRGPKGDGALCYRVTEVEIGGDDAEGTSHIKAT